MLPGVRDHTLMSVASPQPGDTRLGVTSSVEAEKVEPGIPAFGSRPTSPTKVASVTYPRATA